MRKIHAFSLLFFIAGVAFFLIGAMQGEASVGVFIVFPFVIGSGVFSFLGILCIILSFLLFAAGFSPERPHVPQDSESVSSMQTKTRVKGGGVILIGPIPIIFGSSWRIAILLALTGIAVSILLYFLFYYR